ncbi:DUF6427 family protein [Constantimarinum furrinae]|uniref:Beta-carotene 15,15'-monooxygenase n=1 Tax=Constantimarinum furrinae TaxID=2562285 RepID=A0A7G8PT01_9FLAO|nr:DUF6427 family protein [Constantimarinum furrinae]QNJ97467.1 hypothetical protein ALE3EI_0892 [Constantimarinum furrinae]
MLTSFFSKSNPINYLISGILLCLGYFLAVITSETEMITTVLVLEHIFYLGLAVFMMLLLDFVIRKNDLNRQNTYGIVIFSGFLIFFPAAFLNRELLATNMFLLLALRRILSLHTDKNVEKKILDAALWISLAALFYFYALLFFIVLYYAILQRSQASYRYFVIPVLGFFGVFMLANTYYLLTEDSLIWLLQWQKPIGMDFSVYNEISLLIPTAIFGTFLIWTSTHRLLKLKTVSRKDRPNYFLMLVVLLICLFLGMSTPEKSGAEVIFMLGPLAIVTASYLERLDEFLFKELLLWGIVVLPLVLFLFVR